jgi:hypothetical protein
MRQIEGSVQQQGLGVTVGRHITRKLTSGWPFNGLMARLLYVCALDYTQCMAIYWGACFDLVLSCNRGPEKTCWGDGQSTL